MLADLQLKEVVQLTNHAHLKFGLHKLEEPMCKFILSQPKYDIINTDLSNYQLAAFPFYEESLISFSSYEPM